MPVLFYLQGRPPPWEDASVPHVRTSRFVAQDLLGWLGYAPTSLSQLAGSLPSAELGQRCLLRLDASRGAQAHRVVSRVVSRGVSAPAGRGGGRPGAVTASGAAVASEAPVYRFDQLPPAEPGTYFAEVSAVLAHHAQGLLRLTREATADEPVLFVTRPGL
jgi:hypothetical protein